MGSPDFPNSLVLKGLRLNSVHSSIDCGMLVNKEGTASVIKVTQEFLNSFTVYGNINKAFAATVTAGWSKNGSDDPFEAYDEDDLESFLLTGINEERNFADSIREELRLFFSDDGYLAVGLLELKYGDIVCIFFGVRLPYILRQEGDHWRFIGQCYMHGIMHGEAMDKWKAGKMEGVEEEWFDLQ